MITGAFYLSLGIVPLLCFGSLRLPQNFLEFTMAGGVDIGAESARVCLVLQLGTVVPVLCFITRVELLGLLEKVDGFKQISAGSPQTIAFAGAGSTRGMALLCVYVYPHVGDICRFTGAICGFVYCTLLPVFCYMRRLKLLQQLTCCKTFGFYVLMGVSFCGLVMQFVV
jgi:sodium-coupled neutral amino acid transporter 9